MKINPNLTVLENNTDSVTIKIGKSDKIVRMSRIEFEVINYYSTVLNFAAVKEYFQETVEIGKDVLDMLIKKATDNKILIDKVQDGNLESNFRFILKRKKRIFELINIDLTNSFFEKIFENYTITNSIIGLLVFAFSYFVLKIFSSPLNFKENYLKTLYQVPVSFSAIFGFIYLAAFISTLVHEFGHYFIYKRFGGKASIFGFGLMLFFIPVFFNKIFIAFIQKKSNRLFINFGGIFFDFLQFIFLIYFTKTYHDVYPTLSFFGYSLMISITIRTIFNFNIFLPGSDGYFIFTELINRPNFYQAAIKKSKSIIKRDISITYKNYICAVYISICYCFFAFSWCMVFLPVITYLYYASFK